MFDKILGFILKKGKSNRMIKKNEGHMIKKWISAFRLPFVTASVVPVVLGAAVAWNSAGRLNWQVFWMVLVGVCLFQIGTNLTNDYFDHITKNDELNETPTPVSGGSRVIQEGLIAPKSVMLAALIFFGLGSLIGLFLVWQLKSGIILLLGIIGVFCGFFYTAFPLKIGYRGFGELVVGLCFGPLVVFGSYYAQTMNLSYAPFVASIPIAVLIGLVLYINEFPDHEADKLVNKRTVVVMLGKEASISIYHALLISIYIFTFICVSVCVFPPFTLVVFFSLPIALKAYTISKRSFANVRELLPANFLTINLHLLFGLLLSLGFVLDRLL
jgi:1,4-dihydroxy-2-naphthoate octaprenyltransferase